MKKIAKAVVLHNGWEMDNEAWIEKDENKELHLFTTSHGGKREMTLERLDLKIEETQKSLNQLENLRSLIV